MTLYLFLFKKIFLFNNEETQSLIRTGLGIRFQNLKKNEIKKMFLIPVHLYRSICPPSIKNLYEGDRTENSHMFFFFLHQLKIIFA